MIASQDFVAPTVSIKPAAAAADGKLKNLRHSMSGSSMIAAPSDDVDWLVAARRQQRVSPVAPGAAAGLASTGLRSSFSVGSAAVVSSNSTAAKSAIQSPFSESSAPLSSSAEQAVGKSAVTDQLHLEHQQQQQQHVTQSSTERLPQLTAVYVPAPAATPAAAVARSSHAAVSSAAPAAESAQDQAAAAAVTSATKTSMLSAEQERIDFEEAAARTAAASAAAAALDSEVYQAISDFLSGDELLCSCSRSLCRVIGLFPLQLLKTLRSAAAAVAADALLSPSIPAATTTDVALQTFLSHCDRIHASSSLTFLLTCFILSPATAKVASSPAALSLSSESASASSSSAALLSAGSSGVCRVPVAVVQRAVSLHSNVDVFPSFLPIVAMLESIGLMSRDSDGCLSVPLPFIKAGLAASAMPSQASMMLNTAAALRETFWSATASSRASVPHITHFHCLLHASLASAAAAAAAASPDAASALLLPNLLSAVQKIQEFAKGGDASDELQLQLAGLEECVAAAYGAEAMHVLSQSSSKSLSPIVCQLLTLQINALQNSFTLKEQLMDAAHVDVTRGIVSLAAAFLHRAAAFGLSPASADHVLDEDAAAASEAAAAADAISALDLLRTYKSHNSAAITWRYVTPSAPTPTPTPTSTPTPTHSPTIFLYYHSALMHLISLCFLLSPPSSLPQSRAQHALRSQRLLC
jgi:hypothetical protein